MKQFIGTNPVMMNFSFFTKEWIENILIVHSGTFHGHDAMAAAIAYNYGMSIVRTRDKEIIKYLVENGARCYDAGYDAGVSPAHANRIIDHHDPKYGKGFNGKLASMYPMDLLNHEQMHNKQLILILESVAKIDCGEPAIDYISGIISSFNPCWQEPQTDEFENQMFTEMIHCFSNLLLGSWGAKEIRMCKARELISNEGKALAKPEFDKLVQDGNNDPKKGFIILNRYFPWESYLLDYNEDNLDKIKAIVFPSKGSTKWRVQVVPRKKGSHDSYVFMSDLKIDEQGCEFVHKDKWISEFIDKDHAVRYVWKLVTYLRNKVEF